MCSLLPSGSHWVLCGSVAASADAASLIFAQSISSRMQSALKVVLLLLLLLPLLLLLLPHSPAPRSTCLSTGLTVTQSSPGPRSPPLVCAPLCCSSFLPAFILSSGRVLVPFCPPFPLLVPFASLALLEPPSFVCNFRLCEVI